LILRDSKRKLYIIVDEAQLLYGPKYNDWWTLITKAIRPTGTIHVVMFAAYGGAFGGISAATPATIQPQDYSRLALSSNELEGMLSSDRGIHRCDRHAVAMEHQMTKVTISDNTFQSILRLTGRHVGLTNALLVQLHEMITKANRALSEMDIQQLMISPEFNKRVIERAGDRRVMGSERLRDGSDVMGLKVIKQLLFATERNPYDPRLGMILTTAPGQLSGDITRVKEMGALQTVSAGGTNGVSFSSFTLHLGWMFYLAQDSTPDPSITTLEEFIVSALRRMRRSALEESHALNVTGLNNERSWQMEFYAAGRNLVPGSTLSPDVGRVFSSVGDLDFYLNGRHRWGIELTVENSKVPEHLDRFGTDAFTGETIYDAAYINIDTNDFVVLHIRSRKDSIKALREKRIPLYQQTLLEVPTFKHRPQDYDEAHPNLILVEYDENFMLTVHHRGAAADDINLTFNIQLQ